jgi:IS30 family transposase
MAQDEINKNKGTRMLVTNQVENCNRFVRRRYPKDTDFGRYTRADMHRLEYVINSIHRRLLGGMTAYEYDTAYAKAA